MKHCWKTLYKFFFCLILLTPASLGAHPIKSFLAEPISEGGWAAEIRYTFSHFSNGPLSLDLNVMAPFFAYGVNRHLTLITVFPIVTSDFDAPAGGPIPSSFKVGLADFPILAQINVYRKDWKAQNLSFSLIGGLEVPSGQAPFTSNSIDFPFGAVFTFQQVGNEVYADYIYQINTEGNGINNGDHMTYDVAYKRRLLPWNLPDSGEPVALSIDLELNGDVRRVGSLIGGGSLPNDGGNTLFFLSGLELFFKNWIIQTGVQTPIFQSLNGIQLKDKFNILVNIGTTGNFF
jgi:hypothetical protein